MRNQLRQFHSPFPGTEFTHITIVQLMTFCHNGSWKVIALFEQWLPFPPIYWLFHPQNILNKYATRSDMTSFQFQAKSHSPILLNTHLLIGADHMEQIWIEHHAWMSPKCSALHMDTKWEWWGAIIYVSVVFVHVQFYTLQNILLFIFYFVLEGITRL